MKVTQQTQDWGNSTGIRLPRKVLKATKWQPNQEVSIDIRGRSIVLTPINKPKTALQTLEDLVEGITPENVHQEISWGKPTGKEAW